MLGKKLKNAVFGECNTYYLFLTNDTKTHKGNGLFIIQFHSQINWNLRHTVIQWSNFRNQEGIQSLSKAIVVINLGDPQHLYRCVNFFMYYTLPIQGGGFWESL